MAPSTGPRMVVQPPDGPSRICRSVQTIFRCGHPRHVQIFRFDDCPKCDVFPEANGLCALDQTSYMSPVDCSPCSCAEAARIDQAWREERQADNVAGALLKLRQASSSTVGDAAGGVSQGLGNGLDQVGQASQVRAQAPVSAPYRSTLCPVAPGVPSGNAPGQGQVYIGRGTLVAQGPLFSGPLHARVHEGHGTLVVEGPVFSRPRQSSHTLLEVIARARAVRAEVAIGRLSLEEAILQVDAGQFPLNRSAAGQGQGQGVPGYASARRPFWPALTLQDALSRAQAVREGRIRGYSLEEAGDRVEMVREQLRNVNERSADENRRLLSELEIIEVELADLVGQFQRCLNGDL